jgi:hypothetical protein
LIELDDGLNSYYLLASVIAVFGLLARYSVCIRLMRHWPEWWLVYLPV